MLFSKENLYFIYEDYYCKSAEADLLAFSEYFAFNDNEHQEFIEMLKKYHDTLISNLLMQMYAYENDGFNSVYRLEKDLDIEYKEEIQKEIDFNSLQPYLVGYRNLGTQGKEHYTIKVKNIEELEKRDKFQQDKNIHKTR